MEISQGLLSTLKYGNHIIEVGNKLFKTRSNRVVRNMTVSYNLVRRINFEMITSMNNVDLIKFKVSVHLFFSMGK